MRAGISTSAPSPSRELLFAAIEASVFVNAVEAEPALQRFLESDDEELADAADEAIQLSKAHTNL